MSSAMLPPDRIGFSRQLHFFPKTKMSLKSVFTHVASIYANLLEKKESVCVRKEFNSHRTGLGHQHGRRLNCFGTPIWPPWRHVKTLYSQWKCSLSKLYPFLFSGKIPPDGMVFGSGAITVSQGQIYKCKAFRIDPPFVSGTVRVQLRLKSPIYSVAVTWTKNITTAG